MNIIIHRGTHQLGGCITEIFTEKTRIFIDMGAQLNDVKLVPDKISIDGVTVGKKNCDAVFFTHYHTDHIGLYKTILPDIPLYIGETARAILLKLTERIDRNSISRVKQFKTYHALQKIRIGDITVVPLLIDHSAYDAYMFLVEADGKRVLHTGDFRLHGFRGNKTVAMLKKHVGQVDVVITEGTALAREHDCPDHEHELQLKIKAVMNKYKYVFALCASTNIDRIASFYHANPLGRYFLCDQYQKAVLDIVSASGGQRSPLYDFKKAKVYGGNLVDKVRSRGCCMIVRSTPYFKNAMKAFPPAESIIIYSMWDGYLKNQQINDFLEGMCVESLHTSGHASKDSIKAVCDAVAPHQAVIPIHSDDVVKIKALNLNYPIVILNDGEVFKMEGR